MKRYIEYILAISVIKILNLFPFEAACKIGGVLGEVWFFFDKRRKSIALDNLKNAYKDEKGGEEITSIAKGAFRHLIITVVEMCRVYAAKDNFIEEIVKYEGFEHIREANSKGKGVIFLAAHIGNWELGALRYGKDFPMNIVARRLDNLRLEEEVIKIRTMYGNKIIYKKGAVKNVLLALHNKETVGILIDQSVSRDEGVFVDFFGRLTCTTPIIAMMALKTGIPVVPAFMVRDGIGRHRLIFGKEVEIKKSGDRAYDIQYNTAALTKIIESHIREYPEQWLWMHRRWKVRPEQSTGKGAKKQENKEV